MKNKLLALFAATAVAACTLSIAGCKKDSDEPDPSETFAGTVSTQTYSTQSEAVAACVATELSGNGVTVEMTGYRKDGELTESEIEKLNISAEVNGGIRSVEKGKAYFTEANAASAYAAADADNGMYITVYVIKFTPEGATTTQYKYFIPLPEAGESLSMSYLTSVFEADKYRNCTVSCTNKTTSKVMGISVTVAIGYNIAITETQVKINYTMSMLGMSQSFAVYLAEAEETVKCVAETEGQFYDFDLSEIDLEINSISDIYTSQITEVECLTHTKTEYGFKMNNEFLEPLAKAVIDSGLYATGEVTGSINYDAPYCNYYVVEGKLYKMTSHFGGNAQIMTDGAASATNVAITSDTEVKYTNFGTTTVSIPNGAKTLLGIS